MPVSGHAAARPVGSRVSRMAVYLGLTLLATSAAVVILGCGGGSDGSSTDPTTSTANAQRTSDAEIRGYGFEAGGAQAAAIEEVVDGYVAARTRSEWSKACSYVTREKRREFSRIVKISQKIAGKGCQALLGAVNAESSPSERTELARAEVSSIRVDGKAGYVIYAVPSGGEYATPMQLERGGWRVAGIQPRQLKP